jgi:hypothetical protein
MTTFHTSSTARCDINSVWDILRVVVTSQTVVDWVTIPYTLVRWCQRIGEANCLRFLADIKHTPPKHGYPPTGLYGVIPEKTGT